MKAKHPIYLGKSGQIYGPFTDQQFNSFKENGKIQQFAWIWDFLAQRWNPLDPPPPPLTDSEVAQTQAQVPMPDGPIPGPQAKALPAKQFAAVKVVCHDFNHVVAGSLSHVTEAGCQLDSSDDDSTPVFSTRSEVLLNLLDTKSGKTVNVKAQLCGVNKTSAGWAYQIRWAGAPPEL